jgi:hypothetical protein
MIPFLALGFLLLTMGRTSGHELLQRQSSNCTEECAVSVNATLTCAPSPDPFCGCSDFLSGAPGCKQCLTSNNVTLVGFFNSTYVEFIQAVCNCQLPSCGNLTLAEKQCAAENSTDPFCTCPATRMYAPVCYACLEQNINDPIIVAGLNERESLCNVSTASPSGPATPSGSAGPSSGPTFTSAGKRTDILAGWIGWGIFVACLLH